MTCALNVVESILGTLPFLGFKVSLQSPGLNSIHESSIERASIERACRSPTRITEASASGADRLIGRNDLIIRFLKGARRLNPPRPSTLPTSADQAIFDMRVKGCYSGHIHFQCRWHTTTIKSLLKEDKDYWYWAADWVFAPRYAPT